MNTEERSLLVGFDLCNDYSQISSYNRKLFEPESICMSEDESTYLIPTVLSFCKKTGEWFYGTQAEETARNSDTLFFRDILTAIIQNKQWKIEDAVITGVKMLEKFFRKTLSLLHRYEPGKTILKLVVTVKWPEEVLINAIYEALANIGIEKDKVSVLSHSQSYLYYALSQPKELWLNDVGLFDFDEDGLSYYQITLNRKEKPMVAGIRHMDFSQTLGYDLLEDMEDMEGISYIFGNIAKDILYKQLISTVYITGKGFDGGWADPVLKKLCMGRRIFKGQNLYTKGASYGARESTPEGKLNKEILFLTEEMLLCSVSITIYKDGKMQEYLLADAGTPWYEAEHSLEFIIDEEQEIDLKIYHRLKHEESHQILSLVNMPKRPDKMTRIQLRSKCLNAHTLSVLVKDLGFGGFYPATGRVWEKVITIS